MTMTVRVIPQFERVRRATIRQLGCPDVTVELPEGTDDTTAMKALDSVLKAEFKRDPGAGYTWKCAGPKEDGVLLALRVPKKDDGTLDWEVASRVMDEWTA